MNLSKEDLLTELNTKEITKHMGAIIFVSLFMFTGVIGNGHVLAIYGRKMKPSNHRTFIFVLGMIDMTACSVGMPIILVHLTHPLTFPNPALCKTVACVNHFNGLTSTFLMLVVTVDRYRKVCRPLKWQISGKMAKVLCGLVTLIGVCTSWPTLFLFGHTTVKTEYENVTGVTCLTDDQFMDTIYLKLFNTYLILVLIVSFMVFTVLYSFIGRTLFSHESGTLKVKTAESQKSDHSVQNVGDDVTSSATDSATPVILVSFIQTSDNPNLELQKPRNEAGTGCRRKVVSSKRNIVESAKNVKNQAKHRVETRRITIIFFSIVAIFTVSYAPYLMLQVIAFSTKLLENLSLTGSIICNTINWFLYINNMSNAIVYMFLDKKFRSEVLRLYRK